MSGGVVALYGDVNTVGEVEVPEFARPAVPAARAVGRDQYGRPMIVPPGESVAVPYTRASSEAGYLTDGNALRVWQTRRLALALSRYPDLLMRVAVLDPDRFDEDTREGKAAAKSERAELDDLITRALDRDGTLSKADYGTAMHKLSEPGTPRDNVPEAMRADLEAYDHALASRGIVRVESEVFVASHRFRISGTTDGVFAVPGWGRVVGDLKTGQLHPVQHAVQLAAYADAERWVEVDGQWGSGGPLDVRQDVGLLIHALKGTGRCDLYLIDLEHGRRNIALAEQVRDARRSAGLARPFDEVAPFPDYSAVPQRAMLGIADAVYVPDDLEDAAAEQADGSVQTDLALGLGHPEDDLGVQHPDDAAADGRAQAPAGLGARLQRQTEQARAKRDAARAQAQVDPDAPAHLKVRTAQDVRADVEATGVAAAPAVARMRAERLEREAAAQYREVGEEHPGVETVPLATTQAPAGPSSSPGDSAATVRQPPPAQPGGQQQATPPVVDVNGNPIELKGDGFDDLRVSDPLPNTDDTSVARGLVANVLGGSDVTAAQQLAERIALAGSRDEVNALFREHSPRGEWLAEHHQLAQQRVALLGPTG